MNPMQMIQIMRSGGNPHAITNMLRQQSGNNPILNNALNMAEKGDVKGLEQLGRNLCREKNIDVDSALGQIKSMMGM